MTMWTGAKRITASPTGTERGFGMSSTTRIVAVDPGIEPSEIEIRIRTRTRSLGRCGLGVDRVGTGHRGGADADDEQA